MNTYTLYWCWLDSVISIHLELYTRIYICFRMLRNACPRGGHSNTCRRTVRDRGQDAVKRSTRVWNAGQRVNDQFQGRSNGQDNFTHYRIGQRSTPLSRRYRLLLLVFISFLQLQIITPSPQHYEHDEACSNLVIIVVITICYAVSARMCDMRDLSMHAVRSGRGWPGKGLGYARARNNTAVLRN